MVITAKIPLGIALSTLLIVGCSAQLPSQRTVQDGVDSPALRGHRGLQDSTCSNGLAGIGGSNENGNVCCPLGCGQCGDVGCHLSGKPEFDNKDCCTNGVLNNQPDCVVSGAAPCIITDDPPPTPTPAPTTPEGETCSNGFAGIGGTNENGEVCCPLGCGQCGDVGCGSNGLPDFDNKDCCINGVLNNQPDCSDSSAAPCVVTDDPPAPTPAPTTPQGETCSNGFAGIDGTNENGEVCCPLGCGQCGDVGCGSNGLPDFDNKDCCINGVLNNQPDCSDSGAAPCIVDPAPTPAPVEETDACNPNPCNNGGSCALDPGGGHICTCASGYGGMSCQIDTSGLTEFSIDFEFILEDGQTTTWSQDDMDEFRSFADRWENVITHVPCGDGLLVIQAEWAAKFRVNPPVPRVGCEQISGSGHLTNSRGVESWKRSDDVWDSFVTHEMGHAIGIGYLWGKCTNCEIGGEEPLDPKWDGDACPATYNTWLDLSGEPDGTEADIIETDTVGLTGECVHFDFDAIPAELNNKGIYHKENPNGETFLSKLTLSALEDIGYIVDPSKADPFSLP